MMRSLLFVPADGGSKLDKAMASGADAIILDLEDSIAPERKAQARAARHRLVELGPAVGGNEQKRTHHVCRVTSAA